MANLYSPESLGIKPPSGGFQEGGWYNGRQYWGGQLSDPGVINPLSNQQGAGQAVSKEVNAQSAAAQGTTPEKLEGYLQIQRNNQTAQPSGYAGAGVSGIPDVSGGGGGGGVGFDATTAPLNLPDLYKNLSSEAGLADIEKNIADKANSFREAQLKINDNPFLSNARRTGRLSKLEMDYNQSVKNDIDTLAMKKQDIATQLDIATKQFDINSQSAKAALDQFNVLLQSGALAGASGADIAAITRSTGISSGMISSAINAQREKDVQTSVTTVDDGKNIYSVVINSKTGAIISKQVLSTSKPAAANATSTEKQDKLVIQSYLRSDAQKGATLSEIFGKYQGYLEPDMIYQLYNANSKYGPDNNPKALAGFGVSQPAKVSASEQYYQTLLNQ